MLHPRERLSQLAPSINLKPGRFFISVEEFNRRIEEISRDLGRIKAFSSFAKNKYDKIRQRRLMGGNAKLFSELLTSFLKKEFVDPTKCSKLFVDNFSLNFF